MTAAPDLPLPRDWSRARLVGLAAAGQLALLLVAVRHRWFWGGGLHGLLHALEAAGLLFATLLGGLSCARAVRQASSLDRAFLVRAGAALALLAALVPPFLSSDVFDYLARGRVAVLGYNPYTTTVASLATDPRMAEFAGLAQWDGWVMPYGPVCALLQHAFALIDSVWLAAYLWKVMTAAAHVATALLVADTLRRVAGEREARRGLVLWLWNPWLLLESCGSGHNDALQALLLAAMGSLLARARGAAGTSAFGLSLLVKHGSAPIGPLLLAHLSARGRTRAFLGGAGLTLLLAALAFVRYWAHPGGFDWLVDQGRVARGSLAALAGRLLAPAMATVVSVTGLGLLLVVLARGWRRVGEPVAFARRAVLAMVVFVSLCVPNFAPWYHLWWLPLFALANLPVLARVLELLAFAGPLSYLAYAGTHYLGHVHEVWQFALGGFWPALLVLLDRRALLEGPAAEGGPTPD